MSKARILDIFFTLFCLCILAFGILRAKHDLRWSAWVVADANSLNSAIHFANEGFAEHYFMPYFHPGYLGKGPGDFNPINTTGYNIRYPSFSDILNGTLIRLFGENRVLLKSIAVSSSVLALLFCYLTFQFFFSKPIAFFVSFFMGTSVAFLQLLDNIAIYMYSECFRFAILFFFLYSERAKASLPKYFILSGVLWLFLFIEAFNSFDYYIFLQLFFWLYYWLSERRLPFKRLFFLASAPILSFALHKTLAALLLQQYHISSTEQLLTGFLEKTLPFHRGFLAVIKSIPYFFRMMESNIVNYNFGFGFGTLFLMAATAIVLSNFYKEHLSGFLKNSEIWNLNKILVLFALPSISWWVIFPNHAVTFYYTPIHAMPVIALLFSLCSVYSFHILRTHTASIVEKIPFAMILLGCCWSPFLMSSKYLKEYPNLLNTMERSYIGMYPNLTGAKVSELVFLSKELKEWTSYGDIIIAIPKLLNQSNSISEYYAQRRIDSLKEESVQGLKQTIEELKKYRKAGTKLYKKFNPNLKIFILGKKNSPSEVELFCAKNYKLYKTIMKDWILYSVDER